MLRNRLRKSTMHRGREAAAVRAQTFFFFPQIGLISRYYWHSCDFAICWHTVYYKLHFATAVLLVLEAKLNQTSLLSFDLKKK